MPRHYFLEGNPMHTVPVKSAEGKKIALRHRRGRDQARRKRNNAGKKSPAAMEADLGKRKPASVRKRYSR